MCGYHGGDVISIAQHAFGIEILGCGGDSAERVAAGMDAIPDELMAMRQKKGPPWAREDCEKEIPTGESIIIGNKEMAMRHIRLIAFGYYGENILDSLLDPG